MSVRSNPLNGHFFFWRPREDLAAPDFFNEYSIPKVIEVSWFKAE